MLYLITFLATIEGLFIYIYVREVNEKKKAIVKLNKSTEFHQHQNEVLLNLINNLFFSEKLRLEEQSEMSRNFFNIEDLIKYGWATSTRYTDEQFLKNDEDPIQNEFDDTDDDEFKAYLEEEYQEELEDASFLRKCRRDFLVLNFSKKIFELRNGYFSETEFSNLKYGRFVKRFTGLLKTEYENL